MEKVIEGDGQLTIVIKGERFAIPNNYLMLSDIEILQKLKTDAPATQIMVLRSLGIIEGGNK